MTGGPKGAALRAALTSQVGPIADSCPDCDANAELVEALSGVFMLDFRHDTTCPTYRRIVAERGGAA